LARDSEASVVDRTVNAMLDLVFGPLAAATHKTPVPDLTWRILSLIGEDAKSLLQLCVRYAVFFSLIVGTNVHP